MTPLCLVLSSQKVTNIELFIEQLLCASSANHVVIHAELPRNIPGDTSLESGLAKLALDGNARGKSCTAHHRGEWRKYLGKCADRVGREIGCHKADAPRLKLLERTLSFWRWRAQCSGRTRTVVLQCGSRSPKPRTTASPNSYPCGSGQRTTKHFGDPDPLVRASSSADILQRTGATPRPRHRYCGRTAQFPLVHRSSPGR